MRIEVKRPGYGLLSLAVQLFNNIILRRAVAGIPSLRSPEPPTFRDGTQS